MTLSISQANIFASIGLSLVILVILADILLSLFKSKHEGTTWSELLRESVGITAFIPWSISVWIGHWFPILNESNKLRTSIALPILLVLSFIVTVVSDILMHKRGRPVIPPWIISVGGVLAGAFLIPLT